MHNELYKIPSEYREKLFLSPADFMKITGSGKNWAYEHLKNCTDFTVVRVGKKLLINSNSFWAWYFK